MLTLGGILPDDQGGGALPWPEHRDGQRPAPGRHDASCTLVVKLSSATRLSLLAGQPKLIRASLLSQVPGTAIRRPLAVDTSRLRRLSAIVGVVAEAHFDRQEAAVGAEG